MKSRTILLVDDDKLFRTEVRKVLGRAFFVTEAGNENDFRLIFRPYTFDLIILDMRLLKKREGLDLLREIREWDELQPVIMVSAYGDAEAILDAADAGALMFLHKQEFSPDLILRMVETVLQQAKTKRYLSALQQRMETDEPVMLVGMSSATRQVATSIHFAARNPEAAVLITGETGSGHLLASQAIHQLSLKRSTGPFIVVDASLQQRKEAGRILFGSVRRQGVPRFKGLLEQAHSGVLFFPGVGILPEALQKKFAKVLRKRSLTLRTDMPSVPLNFQLIIAEDTSSHESGAAWLQAAVSESFIEIYLPPLRDKVEDIPLLTSWFMQDARRLGRGGASVAHRDVILAFEEYAWPGNVLELQQVISYAAMQTLIDGSKEMQLQHLPTNFHNASIKINSEGKKYKDYRFCLASAEVALVEQEIERSGSRAKVELARSLGYNNRYSFSRRINKAFNDFPELALPFPATSKLFVQVKSIVKRGK